MKIVTVLGSPRKKGNTATVLGWVEEELASTGQEVDRVNVVDLDLRGCLECYTCQSKPDEPGCPQKDDTVAVFRRMMDADAVLYASPLFCWSWSAQIKALIDRHFCLVTGYGSKDHKSLLQGKRAALLVTAAGPEEGNADFLTGMFDQLMGYVSCQTVGKLVVPFCTTPKAIPDTVRQSARDFAQAISGA